MGKIPEYQRNKFASSYVGGSQVDTSGEELVAGVAKAVQTGVNVEAKRLEEKNQRLIDQQANKITLEYSIAAGKQIKALEQQYAGNPDAFPEAVAKTETEMMELYLTNIPDERVGARAGKAMSSIIMQHHGTALRWAENQKQIKAQVDSQESLRLAEIAAGETTDEIGLSSAIKAIYDTTELMSADVDLATRNKLFNQSARAGIIAHLNNVVEKDPLGTAQKLAKGAYNQIAFETADGKMTSVPVSADIVDKYKRIAGDYAIAKKKEQDLNILLSSADEATVLADRFFSREASLTEVLDAREQMERDGAPKEVTDGVDALIRIAYSTKADTALLDDFALNTTYAEWADLEQQLKKKTKKGKLLNPQNFTTALLETRTKMYNRVEEGKIERDTARKIDKELMTPLLKSVSAQRGQWLSDPNAKYYKVLTEKVNNMDLNSQDKVGAKVRAFSAFIDRVIRAKDRGVEVSDEQYMAFAREAFAETNTFYFPRTAAAMTEDSVNATASNRTGVTEVHSNPTDVSGANTLRQPKKPEVGTIVMRYGKKWRFNGEVFERIN